MNKKYMTPKIIAAYQDYLYQEEKSPVTISKYMRDIRGFSIFLGQEAIQKDKVIAYKQQLMLRGYAQKSINSILAAINSFLRYMEMPQCCVKSIKIQQPTYCLEEKELTKQEYLRLVEAAQRHPRLCLLLQTICGTGIRISELQYFTVEAITQGEVNVSCKNKTRNILIPGKLRKLLLHYAKKNNISSGIIFRTKNAKPLDRSNIWKAMKRLCRPAHVQDSKVFPHNLRKLFARTFYRMEKDIAKLADLLGHSNINTTRIYIMTTNTEHRRKIERLGLVLPSCALLCTT